MYYSIKPSRDLRGDVRVPGSKSGTARGLVLGTLAEGVTRILNPMPGIDSYSIIDCCRALGAEIDCSSEAEWIIRGVGVKNLTAPAAVLDVGNSGTGYYLLTTLASLIEGRTVITGDYQICYRPIAPLLAAIREMGGEAISTRQNELAPVVIGGKIRGGHSVEFPGVNVQWLIGLLLCCPSLDDDTAIHVAELGERPYAELTLDWLKAAGVSVTTTDFEYFRIPGGQTYQPFTKQAPSDWCGATYPMVAAAITAGSRVKLLDMDVEDFQGERAFVDIIRQMGGSVEVLDGGRDGVIIEGGKTLSGIEIDCRDMPDAIPALAVLGTYAQGTTVLNNIEACRLKETDRCTSIVEELTKMGGSFEESESRLVIHHATLHGASLSGHHDHRIVMATACAALGAAGPTLIDGAQTVGVSFPRFYEEMVGLGAQITRLVEG